MSSSSLKPPDSSARKPHNDGSGTEDARRSNHTRKASPVKSDHSGSNRSLEKIDEAEEAALDRPEGNSSSMDDNSAQPSLSQQQQQQRPSKQKPVKKGARGKPVPPDEDSAENNSSNNHGDKTNGNAQNGPKNNVADSSVAASSKAPKTNPPDNNNSSVSTAHVPASSPTNTAAVPTANTSPKAKRDNAAWGGGTNHPLSPATHHHHNNNSSGPYTQTLPGRPPPLPAVNSGGSQTTRASYPGLTTKPPGINQAAARGSLTSRPAWDSPHANSLSPAKGADGYTMSADEWRIKADVPAWRKITPVGSAGSGGGGQDAADANDLGQGQGQGPDHGGGGSRRSTISSRDDGLSYAGDEDDGQGTLGRKFTKKMPNKDKFGSSTTLSSATETSDESGDGNFHVVMRVRPLSTQEKQRRDHFVANFPGDGQCSVESNGSSRNFQFNVVFEPDAAQEDVFDNCGIKRLVDNAVSGYTCTAFAFGQTGSGKTHTMTGPPSQYHHVGVSPDPNMYGIIQRSFKYMFQQIKQQGGGKLIRASYLEIYNEQVIDLLNNSHRRYLAVRWSKNKGFYVENLFTVECDTLDDLMAVLEEGLRNRQTGSHGLNEFSSRSHSVLTVTIDSETQPDTEDENLYVTKRGKLSFVDLAGSEKVKDSSGGFGGPGMLESNSINKSLLVLGNCISHLGDAKRRQGHIPYRDSKLTKLLSDSLAGNGITLMIACITPSSSNITETMNTLRYASRAKKIKSKPTVKMDPREKLIMNLKREIKVLRNENHYLRQQLDFPAKPKGQLQKENDEKFMKFMKEQKEKESGLYEMLQEYMVENENLRAENSEMHSTKDRSRREQQLLYRENEKLVKRVEEMEKVMMQNPGMWANKQQNRTDGYGQYDLTSPRGSPVASGYQSGHKQAPMHVGMTSPPGSRGKVPGPMRPPHRLPDHVTRPAQRPVELIELENGGVHPGNNGFVSPRAGGPRQTSPSRQMERGASQASATDAIHSMNEQLKKEVLQLEGQIRHHQYVHERTTDLGRSNGHSVR